MDCPQIDETNCLNKEECENFCECQKQKYLGILRRITLAVGASYSVSDYDPEDYERGIMEAIRQIRNKLNV